MIDIVDYDDNINISKKHFKGYLYDSLVYRYIRAREHMAEWERINDGKNAVSKDLYTHLAHRDIMRFCQILNEAMGEHD